jgi:hypothetical protein
VSRAKRAVASLPWVDQKTFSADVNTEQVKFAVPDMGKFDKTQLLDSFKKHNFPNTTLVSPKL